VYSASAAAQASTSIIIGVGQRQVHSFGRGSRAPNGENGGVPIDDMHGASMVAETPIASPGRYQCAFRDHAADIGSDGLGLDAWLSFLCPRALLSASST